MLFVYLQSVPSSLLFLLIIGDSFPVTLIKSYVFFKTLQWILHWSPQAEENLISLWSQNLMLSITELFILIKLVICEPLQTTLEGSVLSFSPASLAPSLAPILSPRLHLACVIEAWGRNTYASFSNNKYRGFITYKKLRICFFFCQISNSSSYNKRENK